ncbi:MAG: LAGLIDADG family homing endonuclease [Nanoarchaeota archaeon]
MSRYINGTRSFSIEVLNQLISIKKINMGELQNKIEIKIGKSGKYIKIGPFIEPDEKWVYVSELIKGDGHITSNFWTISFVNKENALIKYVEKFFKGLGIKKTQISLIKRDDANFLTIRSSVLAYIFNKILDNPIGKKGELKISDFILSNKKLSISAVRGAFDAEGSVTFTGSRRVSITSNSKNWLNQIKKILETLRIESRITEDGSKRKTPIYRLLIFHKSNLKKFLEIISPLHPKRKEKLIKILGNYTKNSQREFHKKILISIQGGNARKMEIASNIKQDLIVTGNNLNWLKKKEYVIPYEKICTNKGSFHKYKLTPKGEEYLNKSLSFFD